MDLDSLPQLVYVSTANGMLDQPDIRHLGSLSGAYGLLLKGLLHQPGDMTHTKMAGQSGDVMAMSNVTGLPLFHLAMKISAGVWCGQGLSLVRP